MQANQLAASARNVVKHVVCSRTFWQILLDVAKEAAAVESAAYPPAGLVATGLLHAAQGALDHYLPASQDDAPSAGQEIAKDVIRAVTPAIINATTDSQQPLVAAALKGTEDALAGMPGEHN